MSKGKIEIDREKCKGCHLCVAFCPNQCIQVSKDINSKGYYPADFKPEEAAEGKDGCSGCAMCAVMCPDLAIEVYRG